MESVEELAGRVDGGVYGFAMLLTGTVPANETERHRLQSRLVTAIEDALAPFTEEGLNVGSLMLRSEPSRVYIELGLPNARRE